MIGENWLERAETNARTRAQEVLDYASADARARRAQVLAAYESADRARDDARATT